MSDLNKINEPQRNLWLGEFGDEYLVRNSDFEEINENYKKETGIGIDDIFKKYFAKIDKNSSILEVGCNVGLNLNLLQRLGFTNLTGLELNPKTCEIARNNNPGIKFINSPIETFESKDKYDVVFTTVFLIHLNPGILPAVVKKIILLSKEWIFGLEYFSEKPVEVKYRGLDETLFKQDFMKLFLNENPELEIAKEEKIHYKKENLTDTVYLLRKNK
ncbi:MAG: pseudaminic acid biosynthesis-associated methylase [Nitrosotalea sp.]